IEQGTNYGSGDCVKGDYYLAGFKMIRQSVPKPEIEKDIPSLRDVMATETGLGSDAVIGTSLTSPEISDETLMDLVEKHFNAVTLGNELKLDCMLGYNNAACPEGSITKAEIDGKEIEVPTLDHSRADKMLDTILAWNEANPQKKIRVRGHVLVWHSQAPEWFFHEGYDKTKDYVSKETMNLRMEWYIKTMLTYYTGADSKYKDLFYGWDVVNEAVSGESYRTDTEPGGDSLTDDTHGSKSSWWKVYGSNEFIINAFTYANKYAPASLELYYNDYGECDSHKMIGISNLLTAVKEKAGAPGTGTRIDGMGMQGHYNLESPTAAQLEAAVRAYAKIVGKVQLTELDFTASNDFDGTDATREQEYVKQAYKYKEVYDTLCRLDKEDGIDVSGFTVWGVIDKNSWLQSQANVGGGTDGTRVQCPLLFDDFYKAKPSFWALADPGKLEPFIHPITLTESENGTYTYGKTYSFENGAAKAAFTPVWNSNGISVQVKVEDANAEDTDAVTVYLEQDGAVKKQTVKRTDATASDGGYTAEVTFPFAGLKVGDNVRMDVVVTNGADKAAFNDLRFTQEESSKYFAKVTVKPFAEISKGTAVVDGDEDAAWKNAVEIPLQIRLGAAASAKAKALWDSENLYIYMNVEDAVLNADNANAWEQDSVEVFIDENNGKTDGYEDDDKQYRISYENEQSFNGTKCTAENLTSAAKVTANGYVVEAAFKWTDIKPAEGSLVGLEFQINDADSTGNRAGTISWYDESGNGWASPAVFGTVALGTAKENVQPDRHLHHRKR
ncbi:MAG: endo-1,4-beta-xylanase, partial [Lachnospiraceae bacterium]|nr:endo-1,4-beta-xylanase [Lachnospiraceae bacterium]